MRLLLTILLLVSLISVSLAAPIALKPDEIVKNHKGLAPEKVDLSWTDEGALGEIDGSMNHLSSWKPIVIPSFGHYNTESLGVTQEKSVGIPTGLINFSKTIEPIPVSIKETNYLLELNLSELNNTNVTEISSKDWVYL